MTAPAKRRLTIAAVLAGAGIAIATVSGVAYAATESAEPIWATVVDGTGSGAPDPSGATDDGAAPAADPGKDCPDGSTGPGSGSAAPGQPQTESDGDL
ncbi:hypothetical protein [Microlunatus parietis]|uniref:Uncharacterized protein n=1 Tax=Microlunatus parietis TaxID=682979 RepID=A0A7Y9L9I5_9ACTN|nr:hypothetical protein [Microlunatus parietis]NYE71819.1 hypothetical protein [Microlunatus parietis]